MEFIHTAFTIDSKIAIAIQCAFLTDILYECICTDCGKHIIAEEATELLINRITSYTKDISEQRYLFMMWGTMIVNEDYTKFLITLLAEERTNTFLNIYKHLNEYYESITTPLN